MKYSRTQILLLFVYCSISLLFLLIATRNGPAITSDSVIYIESATSFSQGKGFYISTPDYSGRLYMRTFNYWPPLYPFLISISIWLGANPYLGATVISILSFCASIPAIFILSKHVSSTAFGASIASLITCVFWPCIDTASYALSDTPFMFLSIMAVLALVKYDGNEALKSLVTAALLTSAACLARHAGLFLFAAGFIVISTKRQPLSIPIRKKAQHLILYTTISLVPLGIWILRNVIKSHTVLGLPFSVSPDRAFHHFCSVMSFYYTAFKESIFCELYIGSGLINKLITLISPFRLWILFGSLAAAIIILAAFAYLFWKLRAQMSKHARVPCIYVFTYLVLFIAINLVGKDVAIMRIGYISVIWPFLIVLLVHWACVIIRNSRNKQFMYLSAMLLLSFGIILQAQRSLGVSIQAKGYDAAFWSYNRGIEWINRNVSAKSAIYSNAANVFYYKAHRPAKSLPDWDDPKGIQDWLLSEPSADVKRYVVMFKKGNGNIQQIGLSSLEEQNNKYDTLSKVIEYDDSVIFKFKR